MSLMHDSRPPEIPSMQPFGGAFFLGRLATGLLVVTTAVGCGGFERHPVVQVAVEEVGLNPRVREAIGGPVKRTGPVTGSASDADGLASLQFDVAGPSGVGTVVVEGKRLGDEWGVTLLELRRPGSSEHLMLTGDLEARTGTDTPRFDPDAAPVPRSSVPPPPSEIEIPLPPGPGGS
jgi:hypothetical protein